MCTKWIWIKNPKVQDKGRPKLIPLTRDLCNSISLTKEYTSTKTRTKQGFQQRHLNRLIRPKLVNKVKTSNRFKTHTEHLVTIYYASRTNNSYWYQLNKTLTADSNKIHSYTIKYCIALQRGATPICIGNICKINRVYNATLPLSSAKREKCCGYNAT